jgi:NitT/TauT family transport system substrate-binding protein
MRAKAAVLAFALAAALTAGLDPGRAAGLTKVRVATPSIWPPSDPAPQYGKKLGFFADEGIDIELVAIEGATVLLPQIANKSIEFGFPSLDLLLVALDKNEPYPVKAFYNFFRRNPFEFAALASSPLQTLADLKGRKLGVGGLGWGNLPLSRAQLKESGVEWMKDVKIVPVGLGPTAWRRLTTGEVDALNLFRVQHNLLEATGVPLRRLPLPPRFLPLFGNGMVANSDMIRDNPKLVEGFGRAWAKSYYACSLNREACVRAYWEFSPASRPPPDKEVAWIAQNVELNRKGATLFMTDLKEDGWGDYDPAAWRTLADIMYEDGQIKTKDLAVEQVYTRQFVVGMNAWSRDEVRARAK